MEPDGKGVGKDLGVAEEEKINQYICSFKVFSIKLKPRNINQQTYLAYCNTYITAFIFAVLYLRINKNMVVKCVEMSTALFILKSSEWMSQYTEERGIRNGLKTGKETQIIYFYSS